VAGFIASLKVALTAWLKGTPAALLAGFVEITVGGEGEAGFVKNVHTKGVTSPLPAKFWAPVVIVPVYNVLGKRRAAGVKVAVPPAQVTVPGTAVVPGPVNVKVVAGELRVEHFIAALGLSGSVTKVTLMVVLMATPVALFAGLVEATEGVSCASKVQTKLFAMALPSRSLTPVVIVAV
jgi:hypothetical protein